MITISQSQQCPTCVQSAGNWGHFVSWQPIRWGTQSCIWETKYPQIRSGAGVSWRSVGAKLTSPHLLPFKRKLPRRREVPSREIAANRIRKVIPPRKDPTLPKPIQRAVKTEWNKYGEKESRSRRGNYTCNNPNQETNASADQQTSKSAKSNCQIPIRCGKRI